MRRPYRLLGITLIIAGLCVIFAYVLWSARVRHILNTTPLPVTLKQMLHHESQFLPSWSNVRSKVDVALFEGLPHPRYQPEALKFEQTHKSTIRVGSFPFYSEQLALNDDDSTRLLPVLTNPRSFESMDGMAKACGGFHPDYALRLNVPKAQYYVLICLGCYDIKIVSADGEREFALTNGAAERLKAILKPHVKNRPPVELETSR